MSSIFAIVLVFLILLPLLAEGLVLVNGTLIDGSGKPRVAANIRIHEGKIKDIGPFKPAPNESLLDVKGLIVAPDLSTFKPYRRRRSRRILLPPL